MKRKLKLSKKMKAKKETEYAIDSNNKNNNERWYNN